MPRTKEGLTTREHNFVREFVTTGHIAQAYKSAGFRAKNDVTASSLGSRLLKQDRIVQAIEKMQSELQKKSIVTAEWVLNRLKEEAEYTGEGASPAARVAALKILAHVTGVLKDANRAGSKRKAIQTIILSQPPQQTKQPIVIEAKPVAPDEPSEDNADG